MGCKFEDIKGGGLFKKGKKWQKMNFERRKNQNYMKSEKWWENVTKTKKIRIRKNKIKKKYIGEERTKKRKMM